MSDHQSSTKKKKKKGFQSIGNLFDKFEPKEDRGYITREFQHYGCRLASQLDDLEYTSLYIKLAKKEDRGLLESALSFVSDANADNKGALFMWKLKQLKQEKKERQQKDKAKEEKENQQLGLLEEKND